MRRRNAVHTSPPPVRSQFRLGPTSVNTAVHFAETGFREASILLYARWSSLRELWQRSETVCHVVGTSQRCFSTASMLSGPEARARALTNREGGARGALTNPKISKTPHRSLENPGNYPIIARNWAPCLPEDTLHTPLYLSHYRLSNIIHTDTGTVSQESGRSFVLCASPPLRFARLQRRLFKGRLFLAELCEQTCDKPTFSCEPFFTSILDCEERLRARPMLR